MALHLLIVRNVPVVILISLDHMGDNIYMSFFQKLYSQGGSRDPIAAVAHLRVVPGRMEIDNQPGCALAAESGQICQEPLVLWAAGAIINVLPQMYDMRPCSATLPSSKSYLLYASYLLSILSIYLPSQISTLLKYPDRQQLCASCRIRQSMEAEAL